jgi:DNA-binding HxlR family transcriptional regulator
MQRTSFSDIDDPIAQTLEVVGDWWSLMIVREAMLGVQRFEEFQDVLGIARNILSQRLKKLVADEIFRKRVYQENPRRVEYVLTAKGRELFPIIAALVAWGNKWGREGLGTEIKLAHPDTGLAAVPQVVCAERGHELTFSNVVLKDFRSGELVQRKKRVE